MVFVQPEDINVAFYDWLIDWLVFNANFSDIVALSFNELRGQHKWKSKGTFYCQTLSILKLIDSNAVISQL
jgi:hypothetical protein